MLTERLANLDPHTTVLTANRRLATYLREHYDRSQRQQGKSAWPSLDILPLSSWLERCWRERPQQTRHLLSETQQLTVWEQIIADSTTTTSLLKPRALATTAMQTWRLCWDYCIPLDVIQTDHHDESQAFSHWAEQFSHRCQQQHWISHAELPHLISTQVDKGQLTLTQPIQYAGFDEVTPAIEALFNPLRNQHPVSELLLNDQLGHCQQLALTDQAAEISTMARWAQALTQQNPTARIGCIASNLSTIRQQVVTVFTRQFAADSLRPDAPPTPLPFNISAAKPLADYPLIHTALLALTLGQTPLSINTMSHCLRSPFMGHAETEMGQRAGLDEKLRDEAEHQVSLRHCIAVAHEARIHCPHWATQLNAYLATTQQLNDSKKPSAWARLFQQQLQRLGWPGERNLHSESYQLLQSWLALLKQFATLDVTVTELSYVQALHQLNALAQSTVFQPQQTQQAQIHILGMLEAASIHFDHLWVMGFNADSWPATTHPNPLLPLACQCRYNLPHSSSSRDLAYAEQVTQRIMHTAKQVIFSYAQQAADQTLLPSPLITDVVPLNANELVLAPPSSPCQPAAQSVILDTLVDTQGPTVTADEKITGGSGLFKAQAACPFQAFATIRLGAHGITEPNLGLAAWQRGQLVHAALATLWRSLNDQHTLSQLNAAELNTQINAALDEALRDMAHQKPLILKKQFAVLEKKRLQNLLQDWVALEKNRPPFKVVAIEQRYQTTVEGMTLQIQLDRIDQLADGSYAIIDYKTGKPRISDWFSERPDDPQLPLYCLSSPHPINSLCFAQLRADEVKFIGISQQTDLMPNTKTIDQVTDEINNWSELLQHWQESLSQLAKDFLAGHAEVDPKHPTTCQYCDLHALCRIHEHAA